MEQFTIVSLTYKRTKEFYIDATPLSRVSGRRSYTWRTWTYNTSLYENTNCFTILSKGNLTKRNNNIGKFWCIHLILFAKKTHLRQAQLTNNWALKVAAIFIILFVLAFTLWRFDKCKGVLWDTRLATYYLTLYKSQKRKNAWHDAVCLNEDHLERLRANSWASACSSWLAMQIEVRMF